MEDLKNFLISSERFDLLAVLDTLLDEVGYDSPDEDYQPPENIPPEPLEEYVERDVGDEDEYEIGETQDGFYYLR